jgi:putative serine protease PepD
MQIPELGIEVETAQEGGARIVAVTPVGLGERAGLRVGDTIRAVEGKAIRSGQELATELASRPSGSRVGLSYTRGYWGSEAIIVIDQR